jgi:hypothetical protein
MLNNPLALSLIQIALLLSVVLHIVGGQTSARRNLTGTILGN